MPRAITFAAVSIVLAAAVVAGLVAAAPPGRDPDVVVTVEASGSSGTIDTRLGTQFVWPG